MNLISKKHKNSDGRIKNWIWMPHAGHLEGYTKAQEAYKGHLAMCEKWDKK